METVRARKYGNTIMINLSSQLEIKEGQEFYYYKDEKGIISLIPKVEDFFKNSEKNDLIDEEDQLAKDFKPGGSEFGD